MMREIIVDNFAGGGGASTGIEIAVGRSVDIAINHDPAAIAMHQRMIERENALKLERDLRDAEKQRAQLEKRLGALRERYCFRAAGLVLRPFDTLSEVILEGRALNICIGSYARSYAQGGTVLCCLRREEEPDAPWRAVEFSPATGKLVQDRGERNDARGIPPGVKKQLKLFWAAWSREQEQKKGRRSA